MKNLFRLSFIVLLLASCAPASAPTIQPATNTETSTATEANTATPIPSETPSFTPAPPTETFTPAPPTGTFTPLPPTETSTATPPPFVESLKAKVTERLNCRYGPGSEYLSLFGFNKGANIEIIGQTGGNNWVMVENKPQRCWVNAKFLDIAGDPTTLQVRYPDGYKIPVSPYYSSPAVLSAVRDPNNPNMVTVEWTDITLRAGDEEDENMFIYIIEVWRCEGGEMIFDPLASNYPEITFVDETGCSLPSHGRVYFQEKQGFAGPAEILWPGQ